MHGARGAGAAEVPEGKKLHQGQITRYLEAELHCGAAGGERGATTEPEDGAADLGVAGDQAAAVPTDVVADDVAGADWELDLVDCE